MSYALAFVAALVVWGGLFYPFFGGTERFVEALKYAIRPDFIALFQGGWHEEQWEEFRLYLWFGLGSAAGIGVLAAFGARVPDWL